MYRQYSFRSIATMCKPNPLQFIQSMTKTIIFKTENQ